MTPMQELLEWVRATLPMDLDTPQMIEQKIESMLDKEKWVIMGAYWDGGQDVPTHPNRAEDYYNKTFNTKDQ
jgi:hypothetical protein